MRTSFFFQPESRYACDTPAAFQSSWTPNAYNAATHEMILTANITLNAPTNPVDGAEVTLLLVQDGTGSRTLTMAGSGFHVASTFTLTLSTAANSVDMLKLRYHAADKLWYVTQFLKY